MRDEDLPLLSEREHYVYRIFDAAGCLLYIGATRDIAGRICHLRALCNMGRYGELRRRMAYHTVEAHPNRKAAFAAERAAIRAEDPPLNIQSRRRASA